MHKTKFSLADLLTVLGALVFGVFCFLSLNYYLMGETIKSMLGATLIALVVGGLAYVVKQVKTVGGNFKTGVIWEWVLLLLFAGTAFVSFFLFSHYFSVLEKKDAIQTEVTANIVQAEGMFAEYENYANSRKTIYRRRLGSVVRAKQVRPVEYRQYGFVSDASDDVQIDNKMFTLEAQLFPSNYAGQKGVKQVALDWLADAKNTLENKWSFTFNVVDIINKSETNVTAWQEKLKKMSSFKAQGEVTDDFKYPINFKDVTEQFTKLGEPTSMAIGVGVGLYVLMLLSYIVSKRNTKNKRHHLFWFLSGKENRENPEFDIKY